MFEIKDIVHNQSYKNIKNARAHYNMVLDSIFYLYEDIENAEKQITEKYRHLAKLQAQAKMIDQLINDSITNGKHKSINKQRKTRKDPEILYLEELSRMCKTLQIKQGTHTKKQTKNRK